VALTSSCCPCGRSPRLRRSGERPPADDNPREIKLELLTKLVSRFHDAAGQLARSEIHRPSAAGRRCGCLPVRVITWTQRACGSRILKEAAWMRAIPMPTARSRRGALKIDGRGSRTDGRPWPLARKHVFPGGATAVAKAQSSRVKSWRQTPGVERCRDADKLRLRPF